MNVKELIELAAQKVGEQKMLAGGLGMHHGRLTDWKAGRRRPEAAEIAYLADIAGLPILETVAEIEAQLSERHSNVWLKALEDWRARRDSNPRPLPSESVTATGFFQKIRRTVNKLRRLSRPLRTATGTLDNGKRQEGADNCGCSRVSVARY